MPTTIYTAPEPLPEDLGGRPGVFLAGSIENGRAVDWQSQMIAALAGHDLAVFNPRRREWDPSWDCDAANPEFRAQVEWELDAQAMAGLVAFYFAPGTRAPITLLELGLAAAGGKAVVCCPKEFWRSGNVDIVCERNGIRRVDNLQQLAESALAAI